MLDPTWSNWLSCLLIIACNTHTQRGEREEREREEREERGREREREERGVEII